VTNLAELTWVQVYAAARRVLLVPVGSVEQHGPHLPLDTDTRIAVAVASGAAASREGVAVSPAVAFGSSGEHAGFAGTLSIGTEALCEVLVELGRDAARDWDALLFVNAHGGNASAVSGAVARLQAEERRCAAYSVSVPSGDAHAGLTETALLMHLDPGAVRLGAAEAGETRPVEELMARLRAGGVRSVSRNGVLGDPHGATAVLGRRLLDELVEGCAASIDALVSVAVHD
jgi:mycofactocin system creatininase family protein